MEQYDKKEINRLTGVGVAAFIVMIVILVFAGCRTRTVYVPMETVRIDSISYRDTTFLQQLVPYLDSVAVRDTSSFLSNPYAYSHASYSGGMLLHSLGIYPQASVVVRVPYFMDRYVRIEMPKPYPVEKELTLWQRFRMDVGSFSLAYIPLSLLIVIWLARANGKK